MRSRDLRTSTRLIARKTSRKRFIWARAAAGRSKVRNGRGDYMANCEGGADEVKELGSRPGCVGQPCLTSVGDLRQRARRRARRLVRVRRCKIEERSFDYASRHPD